MNASEHFKAPSELYWALVSLRGHQWVLVRLFLAPLKFWSLTELKSSFQWKLVKTFVDSSEQFIIQVLLINKNPVNNHNLPASELNISDAKYRHRYRRTQKKYLGISNFILPLHRPPAFQNQPQPQQPILIGRSGKTVSWRSVYFNTMVAK